MMTNISGWWQWWKWQIWFCMNNNDGGNKNDQAAYHPLKCGFPIHFHVHFPTYLMVSEGHQSHQWWWLRSLKVQSITMITMLMMMMGITVHDLKNKRLEWSYFKIVNYYSDLCWTYLNRPPQACTPCTWTMCIAHTHAHAQCALHCTCTGMYGNTVSALGEKLVVCYNVTCWQVGWWQWWWW